MATLNPTLSGGGASAFEQPVQQPSALGGIADLVGLAASSLSNRPKGPGVTKSSVLDVDKAGFYNELQIGRALVEQGKAKEGQRRMSKAYRTFSSRYGREHEDVNTAFQDATGISFDIDVTGSAVDIEQIAQTPEFNIRAASIQAQNPDMSPDEVFATAMEREVSYRSNDLAIQEIEQQEQIAWAEAERPYIAKVQEIGDTFNGLLAAAQEDQVLTPDEARSLRAFSSQYIDSVRKPAGVDQEKWDKFQEEYIAPIKALVESSVGVAQGQGITSDMNRAIQQIMTKAVSQGKLPPSLMVQMQGSEADNYESFIRLVQAQSKDPRFTDNYNTVLNSTFDELLDWVTEFELKTDITDLDFNLTEYNRLPDNQKRDQLLNGSKLVFDKSAPEKTSIAIREQHGRLEGISQRALQPEDFTKVFSPSYFASLEKIYERNPRIGRQLAEEGVAAIKSQQVAISRALSSEARQLGLKIVGGDIYPDPEAITPTLQLSIDKFFGGDWVAAFEADGVDSEGRIHTEVRALTSTARRDFFPKVKKFQSAQKAVEDMTSRFLVDTGVVQREEGEEVLQGGEGEDTLTGDATQLVALIDRTEGGGDYNTLFKFSNREGKQFAGVQVSNMTLDELNRFSQGEYAEWSREQLGYTATPMGKYQIVGATLRQTMKEMGLPGNIKFTSDVQDAMFHHLATKALAGKNTPAAKRKALRGVWEGFQSVSDSELDMAIAEFEGTPAPDLASIQANPANVQTAPSTSVRPITLEEAQANAAQTGGTVELGETSGGSVRDAEVDEATAQVSTPMDGSEEAQRAAQNEWSTLSNQMKSFLIKLFGNEEGVIDAIANGEIEREDLR